MHILHRSTVNDLFPKKDSFSPISVLIITLVACQNKRTEMVGCKWWKSEQDWNRGMWNLQFLFSLFFPHSLSFSFCVSVHIYSLSNFFWYVSKSAHFSLTLVISFPLLLSFLSLFSLSLSLSFSSPAFKPSFYFCLCVCLPISVCSFFFFISLYV